MRPIVFNGRFPQHNRGTHVGVKITKITCDHESVCLRFDHETEHDYWQELRISANVLIELADLISITPMDGVTIYFPVDAKELEEFRGLESDLVKVEVSDAADPFKGEF